MDNNKIKSDVLQQIMDMMDERMVGDLKSRTGKTPPANDPEAESAAEMQDEDLREAGDSKFPSTLDKSKFPSDASAEAAPEDDKMDMAEDAPEDEDMQRLLEMYGKIK